MFVTGPATPVAVKLIDDVTPSTLAVTWFCPTIVPSVHDAVACPFESVTATRGIVTPFPSVTASATVAPTTARPDASLTFTTIPPGTAVPT